MAVELGLLGPVLLRVDGAPVGLPGVRGQALLARLALAEGRVVPAGDLGRMLWPDDAADNPTTALHTQVHRIRRRLGPAAPALRRSGAGYALDLAGYDVATARRLADAAASALPTDPGTAATLAREALALWRGTALAEFDELPALAAEGAGLAELRLRLQELELEARLLLQDPAVVEEAAALAHAEQFREKPVLLHVAALAANGRAAEAMEVAASYRRMLAEHTGLDPGTELARLERQVAAGLLASDPPGRRQLRRPGSPLVGREQALSELADLLDHAAVVTVTGPGGVGKTRLVQELAADLSGGDRDVAVVRLARVAAGRQVVVAVGAAAGLQPPPEGADALSDALADRDAVLVLDNAEHLLEPCRDLVVELVDRCPRLVVVVTSRAPLDVPGEQVLRLSPLGVDDAMAAFVAHVRRRHRHFTVTEDQRPLLEQLVTRLDCLPLAIELAARQAAHVPLAELVPRLGRSLDVFEAERPRGDERQRTLRSTIEWSLRLLGDDERTLLLGLTPYVGGVSVETVHRVAADTVPGAPALRLLTRLTEGSLLVASGDAEGRYALLETVRAHLQDVLRSSGELDRTHDRFLRWAVTVAEEVGGLLAGAAEAEGDRLLRAELANLDAAVALARRRGDVSVPAALLAALDYDLVWRGLPEIGAWALDLADDPGLVGHPREAAVLASASSGAWLRGELDRCDALADRALALAGDQTWSLASRAVTAMFRARYAEAIDLLERGDAAGRLAPTWWATAGLAAAYAGDLDRAEALVARELARWPDDVRPTHTAYVRHVAGELAALRGDHEVAAAELAAAVETSRDVGATFVEGLAAVGLASAWAASGRTAAAAEGYRELLDRWQRAGSWTQLWTTARNAAALLATHGHAELALTVLAAADRSPRAASLSDRARAEVEAVRSRAVGTVGHQRADRARARADDTTTSSLLDEVRTALGALA